MNLNRVLIILFIFGVGMSLIGSSFGGEITSSEIIINPSQEGFHNVQSLVPGVAQSVFTNAKVPIDIKHGKNKGHGTYVASSRGKKILNSQLIFKTADFIAHTGAVTGQGYIDHYDDNGTFTNRKYFDFDYKSDWFVVNIEEYSENVIGGVTGKSTTTVEGVSSGDSLEVCGGNYCNASSVEVNVTNTPQQYIEVIGNGSMVSTETNIPLHLFTNIPGVNTNTVFTVTVNGTRVPVEKEYSDSTGNVSLYYSANTTAGADFTVDVYWDNNGIEPAANSIYGSENVWKPLYILSLLMAENANDSTSNAHHFTEYGSPSIVDETYGKAMDFDGTNDFARTVTGHEDWHFGADDWSYTMVVNFDAQPANWFWMGKDTSKRMVTTGRGSGDKFAMWWTDNLASWDLNANVGSGVISTATRYVIQFTRNGNTLYMYANNVEVGTWDITSFSTLPWDATDGLLALMAAVKTDGSTYTKTNGQIAEFRLYDSNYSSGYRETEYNNLNNPTATGTGAFYKSISNTHNISSNITIRTDTSSNHNLTDGTYTHTMSSIQQVNSATPYWNNPNTATVTLTIYTTDDPLQTSKTYANGYKNGTMFINHDANFTDVVITANLDNSSVEYSGTIVDLSNDLNVTDIRYNSTNVIWNSTQVNNSVSHWYNYSLPINNASINAQTNQTCEWNLTCTIATSASDVDGNTINFTTSINGTTIYGENPVFTGLAVGTHTINSSVTDKNGTIGGAADTWPRSNLTRYLTVSVGNYINFTFSNASVSESVIYQGSQASNINVDVEDYNGIITAVSVGITYNGNETNYPMVQSGLTWSYPFKSGVPGTYRVTSFNAIDNASGVNSSAASFWIEVVPVSVTGSTGALGYLTQKLQIVSEVVTPNMTAAETSESVEVRYAATAWNDLSDDEKGFFVVGLGIFFIYTAQGGRRRK